MLKALELVGFKSFADKTRFEFPQGITVIVGPNGSGKSNIVDAIKWVLGEQSAKSLRGRDMADVIFKGNGSGGRKVMNTAEATIVFENADGRLPVDAPEVHVTRRVYRSGEGEYLINRQPCRLKDIRDMFRGTGVGTDAYSLIEQGKVDRLLQASPRDRRAIFEEAAGISRFKAKKVEAQRRLERVDQNLLRLSDIVDEVENRLRSVRAQAGKARRYREYSDRLQQLRTQVGLTDWRHLTEKLESIEAELAEYKQRCEELAAQVELVEARNLEMEAESNTAGEEARRCENLLTGDKEQIAARESTVRHQFARCQDLADEAARFRAQLAAMTGRVGDLTDRLQHSRQALAEAETQNASITETLSRHEQAQKKLAEQLQQHRRDHQQRQDQYVRQMRTSVQLSNQAEQLMARQQAATETLDGCDQQRQALAVKQQGTEQQRAQLQQSFAELESRREQVQVELETVQHELADSRRVLVSRQEDLGALQGRHSGLKERASIIEQLERRKEGLGAGVRQMLEAAGDPRYDGPAIRGLVADLVRADMKWATLVDVALGAAAQYVVVDGALDDLPGWVLKKLTGRVGLLARQDGQSAAEDGADLSGRAGVLGRLNRLVEVDDEFRWLADHLLARTWVVDSIPTARQLQVDAPPGTRFVTPDGQLLHRHGALLVGPKDSAEGLVSRRSELRQLEGELHVLRQQIQSAQRELQGVQENIGQQEARLRRLEDRQQQLVREGSDCRVQVLALDARIEQLDKDEQTLRQEQSLAENSRHEATQEVSRVRAALAQVEQEVAELEQALRQDELHSDQLQEQLRDHTREATTARVERAKSEQLVGTLRGQLLQFEEDQRERQRAVQETREQLQTACQRRTDSERMILRATTELAQLYLDKEQHADEIVRLMQRRDQLRQQRGETLEQLNQLRREIRKLEDKQHQRELAAGEVRHQRTTLAERLLEDYGIQISDLARHAEHEDLEQREAVEEEIASLRRKISNIGAVNMEALDELDDLEQRFASLSGQHQDLVQAKEALERIIHKINADSRRLFTETLEAIRTNFQTLYRRAFGGGKADIVLEEGVDILECGVEIIATPPGKPSFNNSLLSGGEKALTAVALLLAIFQYRPSPFCVLDEVDAPFDEANIGRFVDVLKDFLGWTKFVLVTHSKKTMTAANTLYGVTMQESGVSKRVSVRFDDVTEDGHILPEALDREEDAA